MELHNPTPLEAKIVETLRGIFDPEIPVNIFDLGLIYGIRVNEENEVHIIMTLTSPNCPVAESLPNDVHNEIKAIDEVKSVVIELTFDPPWDKDMLSEEAMLELGLL
ncbi:MAG: iron-sulfur cluster assembly protein [Bacteroidota bacterium]